MNEKQTPAPRRSAGMHRMARAIWYTAPGKAELRTAPIGLPPPGSALVKTMFTGISRGTERLVIGGAVGKTEWERMRAPMQEGEFPFPVKYGYCAVGTVEVGPEELVGQTVFCLHPHQDMFHAPLDRLTRVPASIAPRRATLAANMETALNALWDSGAGPADRIVVVGGGIVGLLVTYLAARLPASEVTLVDADPSRADLARPLGATFAEPTNAPQGADVVFHASASAAGLDLAIHAAGFEGIVVELSWYGDKPVTVALGNAFHSQRLKLISTQVGHVSDRRRARWTYARRMAAALRLLEDDRLDALVTEEIGFADAPHELPRILGPGAKGLAPVIRY